MRIGFWELDLDPDGDGWTTRAEYFAGTDPFDAASRLDLVLGPEGARGVLAWPSVKGARYQVLRSADLAGFTPWGDPVAGSGEILEVDLNAETADRQFFKLEPLEPGDEDGDGLSTMEEWRLGTNPANPDTDGDTYPDGREVLEYFTDPLVPDFGGTIEGIVKTDPNRDGDLADGAASPGVTVWLDANYDGVLDEGGRRTVTDETGAYAFPLLPPGFYHVRQVLEAGHTQTLPAEVSPLVVDGWPDEMVSYVHAATGANFPGAYGYLQKDVWPGHQYVIIGQQLVSVDPAITLKPVGQRYIVPPLGIYNTTEMIALPEGASLTLRFEETIIDGPGDDLSIFTPMQGGGLEPMEIWLGATEADLRMAARVDSLGTGPVVGLDLAETPVPAPVRFVKFLSRSSGGVDLGVALTGVQALHTAPSLTDARAITITARETVSGVDFGRVFLDLPPVVLLEGLAGYLQQGVATGLRLVATDDLGVASLTAQANGAALPLAADGAFSLTPAQPGLITLTATATDSGGQAVTETWPLYITDETGELPFDPTTLGAQDGGGAAEIRVFSPGSGDVVTADTLIIATLGGPSALVWEVSYAPVDLVDPGDLAADDSDYISLASGSSYQTSAPIAVFPGGTVGDGIYLLRVKATPSGGGATRYHGQIIAKGVDAASLQPVITLTAPADGALTGLVQDIAGSITSERPLTSWSVDLAPREQVDLNDLGSEEPEWETLASGTAAVSPAATLARLDTTRFLNGSYVVRVVAWNNLRLGRVEAKIIEITGDNKLGRHRREFTDALLNLAGFPIKLTRVYDSFAADKVGDFGYGWSLGLVTADIGETVPRTGSGIFGQTAYREGTRVYLTGPDGKRVGFTFHPEYVSPGVFGANYRATFTADPGVYDRLEVPQGNTPFITLGADGGAKLLFIGLAWNPDTFVLVRPDGTRYTYHETRGFLEAEDANGNTLTYNGSGFEHSGGMAMTFTRDAQGRITSAVLNGDKTWTYHYDAAGDLLSVTDYMGQTSTYDYLDDPAHFLSKVTDAYGRTGNVFEYDEDGRLTAIVDPAGNRTRQSTDPLGFSGSITDGRGNVTQFTYDQRGNVLTATDPLGGVTTYTYGDARHPDKETSITDALGQVTKFDYDAAGNRTAFYAPGSFFPSQSVTYNTRNQPLVATSSDGRTETREYDERGNLTREALWHQPERRLAYNEQRLLETETVNGLATSTAYDHATGLPVEFTDENGYRLTYTRGPSGLLTGSTTATGGGVTVTTGPGTSTLTDGSGATAGTVRNSDGSLTINNWDGGSSRFLRSPSGVSTYIQGPDGFRIQPERDANGNITAVTDALGNRHTMAYDALDRLTTQTDALGRSRTFAYNAIGRVTEITDRIGRKKHFTYNSLNQVTKEEWLDAGGAVARTWNYNFSTHPLRLGSLVSISDGASLWEMDGADRPTSIYVSYAGQLVKYRVAYQWTAARGDVPEEVTLYPGSNFYLSKIGLYSEGSQAYRYSWDVPSLSASRQVRLHYDAMRDPLRMEYYNASPGSGSNSANRFAVTDYTRDVRGRLTRIAHTTVAGGLIFPESAMDFTRTPGGTITAITEPGNATTLAYDAGWQLTGATHTARAAESYTYDAAGNRLTSHIQPVAATVGAGNQLLTVGNLTLEYDLEGNLAKETNTTTGAIREFAYDHNNQLVRVQTRANAAAEPVVVAEYLYDFQGRQIRRAEGGVTTWVLYDRAMPIAEFRDGESTASRLFFYAPDQIDRHFATWDAVNGERWFLQDHRQSVRGVIRPDGTPVVWADYDAFGNLVSGDPALLGDLRFTGRFWSDATGLHQFRARHYSAELGRFLQPDPAGFAGGDLNLYRYTGNNPHNKTDPTGLVAALEYVELVQDTLEVAEDIADIGECVCRMIGAAANGLRGVQSANPEDCVGDAFGPDPDDYAEETAKLFIPERLKDIYDLLDPPDPIRVCDP